MAARFATKVTTGLVGMAPVPEARTVLIGLYSKTLQMLQALPAEAEYRRATEKLTLQRKSVVENETEVPKIEATIACGQIEELIKQAEDEILLIPKMLEWKPWESLETPAPPGQWQPPGYYP